MASSSSEAGLASGSSSPFLKAGPWQQPTRRCTEVLRYFVGADSVAMERAIPAGKVFPTCARVNVPVGHSNVDKLQEELEAHPLVKKVEKKADKPWDGRGQGHESDYNLKVWLVDNRVDTFGYSKHKDKWGPQTPASGGKIKGVSLNHAWVAFGSNHSKKTWESRQV